MIRNCAQNDRERWGLLLIDEQPDRLIAFPLMTARCARCAGVSVGKYCTDAGAMAAAHLAAFERFGHGGISLFSDVGIVAEAMGSGLVHTDDDIPSLDAPVLGPRDDPGALKIPKATDGRIGVVCAAAATCHDRVGDLAPVFGFVPGPVTTAAMLAGPDEFLSDLVMDPERAAALLDLAGRACLPMMDALMVAGALPVIVDPLASGSVLSPSSFRDAVHPAMSAVIRYMHRFDLDVMLHVCGKTGGMLHELADSGADLLSLDLVGLTEASAAVGDRCRIVGNVSTGVMLSAGPADVRAAVESAIGQCGRNPKGFVVSTGCEVPVGTPDENIEAFMDAVREGGQ